MTEIPSRLRTVVDHARALTSSSSDLERVALEVYARHHAGTTPEQVTAPVLPDEAFARRVLEPHADRVVQDPGWQSVDRSPEHGTLVIKAGVVVRTPESGIDGSELTLPAVRRRVGAGYLAVIGPHWSTATVDRVDRYYLHLDRDEAADAFAAVISAADALLADHPWTVKALSAAALYPRHDAVVLYTVVPARRLGTRAMIEAAVATHRVRERPVSPFAADLGHGIGALPGTAGTSAGLDRCRIVAEACARWHRDRPDPDGSPDASVLRAFARAGLDIDPSPSFVVPQNVVP